MFYILLANEYLAMFRLLSLKISNHPILGNISSGMDLVGPGESGETGLPYTTLVIGPNGSGKSFILASIVEIFESLNQATQKKKYHIGYDYKILYLINQDRIEVTYLAHISSSGKRISRKNTLAVLLNGKELAIDKLRLPTKVIALSFMAMDRFRAKANDANDFYTYLGLRDRSNTVRTNTFLNNSLPMLFEYIQTTRSLQFLKQLLEFLDFAPTYLGLQYNYRYKNYFFTGKMAIPKFKKLFGDYTRFSKRKSLPYGVEYYDAVIKGNDDLIKQLVDYINLRVVEDNLTSVGKSVMSFNLFDRKNVGEELILVEHLRRLDLLASATLLFKKDALKPFAASQSSSGEFHFLTTMIAVQASIKADSLVLIDEPENSLHPNWQMKYIETLKGIFKDRSDSHFVICTHSHFLVGDSRGNSSEILSILGKTPNIIVEALNSNTFGWSPDEILYKVFGLRTTRNLFFEYDLTRLAYLINSKSDDKSEIDRIVTKLLGFRFSPEDPLNRLISAAQNYIQSLP